MIRIVFLGNVSTDRASAIEDGLETNANTAKGGSSKCRDRLPVAFYVVYIVLALV